MAVQDELQEVFDKLMSCRGLIPTSPIFFDTASAPTKNLDVAYKVGRMLVRSHQGQPEKQGNP